MKNLYKLIRYNTDLVGNARAKRFSRRSSSDKSFKRIYHFHIRKTGGTSINKALLGSTGEDPEVVYSRLSTMRNNRYFSSSGPIVGWNREAIEKGHYFYAFSHIPYHSIALPPHTYRFTCFRDPVERLLSHYRMLLDESASENPSTWFPLEQAYIEGGSFLDFCRKVPDSVLLNQLHMFSNSFCVKEARDNIFQLNAFFVTEALSLGFERLRDDLRIPIEYTHIRRSNAEVLVGNSEKKEVKKMLSDEYQLLEILHGTSRALY